MLYSSLIGVSSYEKINTSEIINLFEKDPMIENWGYSQLAKADHYHKYKVWVDQKNNGILNYLSGERGEKRKSLKDFYPAFESAIVFSFSYAQAALYLQNYYRHHPSANGLKIAAYTLGQNGVDYHHAIRAKLVEIQAKIPVDSVIAMDVHPVLDRDLAYRAGLGWYGKNSMLINTQEGSYNIIGSLLFSSKLALKQKVKEVDHCGHCTKCAEACPTDAIDLSSRTIIANKCISTYTIESFKEETLSPPIGMENSGGEIFGCDICQDVCPWNKKILQKLTLDENVKASQSAFFNADKNKLIIDFFLGRDIQTIFNELVLMSNRKFKKLFQATNFERSGRLGLLKNIKFYLNKKK